MDAELCHHCHKILKGPHFFATKSYVRRKRRKEGKEFNPQFDGPARQPATTIDVEHPHKT